MFFPQIKGHTFISDSIQKAMRLNLKEPHSIIYACESFVACIHVHNVEEKNHNLHLRTLIVCYYF